jgi:hypothetical protein
VQLKFRLIDGLRLTCQIGHAFFFVKTDRTCLMVDVVVYD